MSNIPLVSKGVSVYNWFEKKVTNWFEEKVTVFFKFHESQRDQHRETPKTNVSLNKYFKHNSSTYCKRS